MRSYVRLIGSWLRVDDRTALLLLTAEEVECLAVEALCRRAVWS